MIITGLWCVRKFAGLHFLCSSLSCLAEPLLPWVQSLVMVLSLGLKPVQQWNTKNGQREREREIQVNMVETDTEGYQTHSIVCSPEVGVVKQIKAGAEVDSRFQVDRVVHSDDPSMNWSFFSLKGRNIYFYFYFNNIKNKVYKVCLITTSLL